MRKKIFFLFLTFLMMDQALGSQATGAHGLGAIVKPIEEFVNSSLAKVGIIVGVGFSFGVALFKQTIMPALISIFLVAIYLSMKGYISSAFGA